MRIWLASAWIVLLLLAGVGAAAGLWGTHWAELLGPADAHAASQWPLGTNAIGQDRLARLLQALARVWESTAPAALIAAAIGTLAGAACGLRPGGLADRVLASLLDAWESVPSLLLLLWLGMLWRDSSVGTAAALVLVFWTDAARPARAIAAGFSVQEHVLASRASGLPWRTRVAHLLRHMAPFVRVQTLMLFAACIKAELVLGFVGMAGGDRPTLGGLLAEGALRLLDGHLADLTTSLFVLTTLLLALHSLPRGFLRRTDPMERHA